MPHRSNSNLPNKMVNTAYAHRDNVDMGDTRSVSVGPWFNYDNTHEKEIMAIYCVVVGHLFDNSDDKRKVVIPTALSDPVAWEKHEKRHIKIAQSYIKNAL